MGLLFTEASMLKFMQVFDLQVKNKFTCKYVVVHLPLCKNLPL